MINSSLFTSKSDEWATPQDFFNSLDREFHFTLDVCASEDNHKCERYFTKADDGLKKDWGENIVWCNPPYGREVVKWVQKCSEHCNTAVMLLPARTDVRWFHDYIYQSSGMAKTLHHFQVW